MNFIKTIPGYFLIAFLVCGYVYSQESDSDFEQIGPEQGLTASSVLCILQDRQGFMWFGTDDGLFRFDGYGMTVYKHDRLDSTSLGNNNVFTILEDRGGTLWLGTAGGGLNRFDRKTEQFIRYLHDPDDPNSISADVVSALYEDRNGILWAGTWEGLNKIDSQTGKITRVVHDPENPDSMNPDWIRSICEDKTGAIWVGTEGGISRLNRESGQFTHFVENRKIPGSLSNNVVNIVFKDHSGIMWAGSRGGLDRFDYETQLFTSFRTPSRVTSICEDRTGALWIGTSRGLYSFSSNRDIQFLNEEEEPVVFKKYVINDIYEDNTGTIWIASDHGVYRYDRGQKRFKHLVHDPDNPNSLTQDRIRSMCEDSSGALWIGTAGEGLAKYDPQTRQFQYDFPGLENEGFSSGPDTNYTISSLYMDHLGVLWIGQGIGLGRYDTQRQRFMRFVNDPKDPYSLSGNIVLSIFEDRTGVLWVGTFHDPPGGLDRFDRQRQKFDRFDLNPENTSGLGKGSGGVFSISEGNSGRLWFATGGVGVCLFDRESETFTRFTHIPGNLNSLSHGWVGAVHEDRRGMLWAAPWYGGLNKIDPQSGQVTIYTEKDGLPSNYISSITEDDHGRLWLTTKNGLSRFDPPSKTFKNFDANDGLLNTDFEYWNVNLKSRTGEVYFGGENGIDYVHPDSIRDNPYIPPVVFTRFTRYNSGDPNGGVIIEKGVSQKHRLELSYKDHILSVEFAALNYRASHKNQYAYKLEGFEDDWIQLGNKHEATFTNLNPGEYTLRVKGSNNDGIWNEEGASLIISISPPWWQTGWAYALYAVLMGLTLYGVRRFELKRVQLRNELEKSSFESRKLQEIDRMKSRFFADISHEFRTPLTLILGPLRKFLSTTKDGEKREDLHLMQRNAHRLQHLIDQLLDLSRVEARRMPLRARQDDIVEKLREWAASFVSLAQSKHITLNLDFPEQPVLVYFDAEKLEKMVYNLLSNAFKFTPEGGTITVAVNSSSGCFEFSVRDSGIGIPRDQMPHIFDRFYRASDALTGEQRGTGIGLALTKEFVELHHGEIRVESEPGKGSTFTVVLPLGRAHLSDDEVVEPVSEAEIAESSGQPIEQMKVETASVPETASATAKTGRALVLIVEDNPDMRRYLRNCLSPDFDLLQAENGQAGHQSALKSVPDLVVSDVMMPGMDGFELCRRLKTDQRTSHIPVVLLTARAGQEDRLEGLETGADDYLTKPFDAQELRTRVTNLIGLRRQLHERFRRELLINPAEITATSMDEAFLKKVIAAVEAHIDDPAFETDDLAGAAAVGRRQLNRKLRALTGQSVREFIRTIRLKRAAQLLQQQTGTVTEIAYEVGFNNPGHFAKIFREQFGVAPSEYGESPGPKT